MFMLESLWPDSSLSQDQLSWIPESTISNFEMASLTKCTYLCSLRTPTLCLLGQFYIIRICSMSWTYRIWFLGHLKSFLPPSLCQLTEFYDLLSLPWSSLYSMTPHNATSLYVLKNITQQLYIHVGVCVCMHMCIIKDHMYIKWSV